MYMKVSRKRRYVVLPKFKSWSQDELDAATAMSWPFVTTCRAGELHFFRIKNFNQDHRVIVAELSDGTRGAVGLDQIIFSETTWPPFLKLRQAGGAKVEGVGK